MRKVLLILMLLSISVQARFVRVVDKWEHVFFVNSEQVTSVTRRSDRVYINFDSNYVVLSSKRYTVSEVIKMLEEK